MIGEEREDVMIYRVIRTENGSSRAYDFDDIGDARDWISQEIGFDEEIEADISYELIEVE
ncbi:MAG: hypothetical protein EBZ49_04495 [Proteobacteria bacterium]|nr:hypothetical protein [Pseudomonadota bacterium]